MELRHLRYFVAVAEEGHMRRAASRLGIQQPPLTQQIRALEKELGVELFWRAHRKIELSDAGRLFLDEARAILQATDTAVRRIRAFDQGVDGTLRVGLTSSSLMHPCTQHLFRRLRTQHPNLSLQIEEGVPSDLFDQLGQGKLDAAFVRTGVSGHPRLAAQWIGREAMVVALPDSHPLARRDAVPLIELQHHNLILYRQERGEGFAAGLLSRCAGAGFSPRIVDETRRLLPAVNMVAAGIGVTVVPHSVQAFQAHAVRYLPLATDDVFEAPLNLVYRLDTELPALRSLRYLAAPSGLGPIPFLPSVAASARP